MDVFVKALRKISIRKRLAYAFLILCVVPISVMIIISAAIEFIYYNNNLSSNYENFAYESNIRVNDVFEQLELKFKYLKENNDILTDLYLFATTQEYQTDGVTNRIENTIASIMSTQGEIDYTSVFLKNGTSFLYSKVHIDMEKIKSLLKDDPGWYYLDYGRKPVLCRTENIEIDYTIGLKERFVVLINLEEIEDILDNAVGSSKQKIAIIDSGGRIVAGSQFEKSDSVYEVTVPISDTGLSVKNTFSRARYDLRGLITTILIFLLVLIASGATLYLVNESIKIPLNRLLGRIEQINEEDVFVRKEESINADSKDEHVILNNVFTSMLNRLNEVLEETYITKINETELRTRIKELELVALQQRINPHFLYNTLDSLYFMAIIKQDDDIAKMVLALSNTFKLSLNKGDKFITVRDELNRIKEYMTIQNMRYNNRFDLILDLEEIEDYKIITFILQPFVENAMYHGLEAKIGKGYIKIEGYQEDGNLYFAIKDNGIGIADLSILDTGYGVKNVKERIKLFYGDEYGVSFASEPYVGTTVTIVVQAKS